MTLAPWNDTQAGSTDIERLLALSHPPGPLRPGSGQASPVRGRGEASDEGMMALMRACMLFPDRDPVPSVETPLHALLPYRFIAHTHDIATLALTDTPHAEENVRRVFGDEVAFLEYVRPGYPLAKRLAERYAEGPPEGATALVMEKHGLAVRAAAAR